MNDWWVISGPSFLQLLRRAASGEDPDLLLAEEYANGNHEPVE